MSGEWIRTFAVITTDANEMVAEIHDRMPLILASKEYTRWLSEEPDPSGLMRPYPSEPMRMWPIATRVNKPEYDDPSIVEPRTQRTHSDPATCRSLTRERKGMFAIRIEHSEFKIAVAG